eukprot:scaffold3858_cov153-Skeletonema_menzelii.AAC.2
MERFFNRIVAAPTMYAATRQRQCLVASIYRSCRRINYKPTLCHRDKYFNGARSQIFAPPPAAPNLYEFVKLRYQIVTS